MKLKKISAFFSKIQKLKVAFFYKGVLKYHKTYIYEKFFIKKSMFSSVLILLRFSFFVKKVKF